MPRKPIATSQPAIPALASIGASLSAALVAAVLAGVAGAIVLVAASFALYAEMKDFVAPAMASAITAAAFAVIAIAIAVIAPAIIRSRASAAKIRAAPSRPALDAGTVRMGVEIALALISGVAEVATRRRASKRQHDR
jgi:hypothetical protein